MDGEPSTLPLSLKTPSGPPAILLDTLFLVFLRLVYFLLARRFLLSTLNPTLRDLSKTETLLAPTASLRVDNARSNRSLSLIPLSDGELDTEDDNPLSRTTPNSSFPPSPSKPNTSLLTSSQPSRDPFTRRKTDEGFHLSAAGTSSLPAAPDGASGGFELQALGQKLKDVGAGVRKKVDILQLSHGQRGDGGVKGIKQAMRGLSWLARVLFSLCFAESCNLVSLVMFHALGILHSRSRHINFSVSLHILLAMILLVVPLVQCMLLTYRSRGKILPLRLGSVLIDPLESSTVSTAPRTPSIPFTSRLLISLVPFGLYCFLWTRIPPYVTALPPVASVLPNPIELDPHLDPSSTRPTFMDGAIVDWTSGPEGWEGSGWLASSLGRVIVLGVVVLGALSGFGAVRTAWGFFEHAAGASSRALDDNDILQAERSLYRVRHELVAKRDELSRLGATTAGPTSERGWMGRVFGGKYDQEMAALQAELSGLGSIERQVARSLSAMKTRKRRQEFSVTFRGKIYTFIGYIFAIYCSARLLMCLPSIFFAPLSTSSIPTQEGSDPHGKGNTNGDWISFLLALGISHLPTGVIDIDVAVWSRAISLLLTGLLILSSLTQVLRSLSRILRLTSKTVGAGFLLLSLGQLFSTYIISLLVQLRTTLPPAPAMDTDPFSPFYGNSTMSDGAVDSSFQETLNDSLLSSLPDFHVFGRLFDVVFLLAAVGTALYRYIVMKVNPADDSGDIYQH